MNHLKNSVGQKLQKAKSKLKSVGLAVGISAAAMTALQSCETLYEQQQRKDRESRYDGNSDPDRFSPEKEAYIINHREMSTQSASETGYDHTIEYRSDPTPTLSITYDSVKKDKRFFTSGKKIGLIDSTTEKRLTPAKYDEIIVNMSKTYDVSTVALYRIGKKWGLIEISNGKEITGAQFDKLYFGQGERGGFFYYRQGKRSQGEYGYVDSEAGKFVKNKSE